MPFEQVWENIMKHEGEEFQTKTGLPFSYAIEKNAVVPDRTGYRLSRVNFEKALSVIDQVDGPGAISDLVRGSAYVYAILKDARIK